MTNAVLMQVDEEDPVVLMDDLVDEVCWHLLAGSRVGRLAFTVDGDPWVLPFNYSTRDKAIVFRTAEGSMFHALGDGAAVAVEIDHVDGAAQTGWSVLARGHAWELTDEALIASVADGVHPWAPGVKDRWMWILPHAISGRAISRKRATTLPASMGPG
jgi:nitroimidazol reductase NimA-like FMN-containing flavoprotein (pyridoxamine 5'-phosphate oxidase superfamily)